MVPLSVHSHYSLMRGANSVAAVCRAARRMGYRRLALTDTDNLYGLWPFLEACRREDLTPIVGAQVTCPVDRRQRVICLAADETGYSNLCRILTRRHQQAHLEQPLDLVATIIDHARGLVVLSADPSHWAPWQAAGVDLWAALERQAPPPSGPLLRAARRMGVLPVAVSASFCLDPREAKVCDLLRAIDGNTVLSRLSTDEYLPAGSDLADPAAYLRRFATCPEALANTLKVADRIHFKGPDFGVVMPPLWQADIAADDAHVNESLRKAAYTGAQKRYGQELSEAVVGRLEHELRAIAEKRFSAYFLIVRDIVSHSPRTCGRGSGAASLVAYCLGITNVCPVKHNLYFERFLNPGRSDPPDIDVDFAWDERDGVIERVLERFKGHAAMVCNHVLFQPRMAVREVAKVYGLTEAEIGRMTGRMPWHWHRFGPDFDLMADLRTRPEFRATDFSDPWSEIFHLAQRIIGHPRYLSVHPGGVVITPRPITEYVPIETAPKGVPIIQWEKEATETAGLVKIDLLGNRSLGVIRDALLNMQANGIHFDERYWEPEDDYDTQTAVAQGRTMGCFYIESPAMRQLHQKAGVGDFEHLVIHSSIIRPAANEFIQEYVRRLHGGTWEPIHPLLTEVLDETFGIMVYQEDVSRTAVALAGFSHSEADALRKIMSKKDKEREMRDFARKFTKGARERGVSDEQIRSIWDMMLSFSGYSFCKPHSASYARVSFQAAYLKTHYPAEFMAAVISNQGGFYSIFAYVSESRRMGLAIQPPDVTGSQIHWTGKEDKVRVGLMTIKGLSVNTQERIITQREANPFIDLKDFFKRARPAEDEGRALIHSGALDYLATGANRAAQLWHLAWWHKRRKEKPQTQQLFGTPVTQTPPQLPPEDPRLRLQREFSVLGFLCSRHPMTFYAKQAARHRIQKVARLHGHIGERITVAGWLVTGKRVRTKHNEAMQFLTFEDETGILETTFFPKAYARYCHIIEYGRPFLLTGIVEQDWGALTLTVNKVQRLRAG